MKNIFCDFDGTITNRDSIVFLTEYFGAGSDFREEVLNSIKTGRMSVFEAIRLEMETVKASWAEAKRVLKEHIHVDPSFPKFVEWTRKKEIDLTILSSGMGPILELFVGKFEIPIFAHHVIPDESGWIYERKPEHDKERILEKAVADGPIIFIGDGTSDVAAVPYAEILFARKDFYLAEYCRQNEISHHLFENFEDILISLDGMLDFNNRQGFAE